MPRRKSSSKNGKVPIRITTPMKEIQAMLTSCVDEWCDTSDDYQKAVDEALMAWMTGTNQGGVSTGTGLPGSVMAPANGRRKIKSPQEAAEKFIECLQEVIRGLGGHTTGNSGRLGPTAIDALTNLSYNPPTIVREGKYLRNVAVDVYFTDDLSRPSLDSSAYPNGAEDISVILNSGYYNQDNYTTGGKVSGEWHGDNISSRTKWSGAHFIEEAIRMFRADYAIDYGVVDIIPAEVYNIR